MTSHRKDSRCLPPYGSLAVGSMFVSYWLEHLSRWFVLSFAVASATTAGYSGLLSAYPITARYRKERVQSSAFV